MGLRARFSALLTKTLFDRRELSAFYLNDRGTIASMVSRRFRHGAAASRAGPGLENERVNGL